MALGGGTWATQNKVLPGTYINFSSAAKASASLSDRGFAAMPLMLDWGADGEVFAVTNGDFEKDSLKIFGHAYTDDAMLPLREIFKYAKTLYVYRLNGGGAKAENTYCQAKYTGTAGNKLSTVIAASVDDDSLFTVETYFDMELVDTQVVSDISVLKANDFVEWKSSAELAETARTPLTGGTNGTAASSAYQSFLNKIESYSFNTLGCPSSDEATIGLFVNFTKRMRDDVGAKFQTVIYNPAANEKFADYEGVIEVGNAVSDTLGEYALIYWVTGASAGCMVNKSNTNKPYDGELIVNVDYTQTELETALKNGRFMLHNVNGTVCVLEDISSLVTLTDEKGEPFKSNQTVRVCDQIANDIAVLFSTRYLGRVPNDNDGRVALWNDICKLHQELEAIRALEDFDPASVTVEAGESKKSVLCRVENLSVVNAMAQLYMSVIVQ